MANAVVTANLTIQIQDATVPNGQVYTNRTVPPVSYPSNNVSSGFSYASLSGSGGGNSVVQTIAAYFIYVRNVGNGPMKLTVGSNAVGSGSLIFDLNPGGVFMIGNNSNTGITLAAITTVTIQAATSTSTIAEYFAAQ